MKSKSTLIIFGFALLVISCNSKPKVIRPQSTTPQAEATVQDPQSAVHEVVVEDFLHASRYTYLHVTEAGNTFWIAIPSMDVQKGETYYYQGGVRMHNFESKEHNRVFETLYLVGGVSNTPKLGGYTGVQQDIDMHGGKSEPISQDIVPIEGGIQLSDLFSNVSAFGGKMVTVKGQCVKVNHNIMGKNWIHLQDGSIGESNNNLDLTISTQEDVSVGEVVVFEGKIAVNKDFGSGYRYDVIMEEAKIKY